MCPDHGDIQIGLLQCFARAALEDHPKTIAHGKCSYVHCNHLIASLTPFAFPARAVPGSFSGEIQGVGDDFEALYRTGLPKGYILPFDMLQPLRATQRVITPPLFEV